MSVEFLDRRNAVNLEIFSDEINPVVDQADGSKWMYIGVLFVPVEKKTELIEKLKNLRCITNSKWHDNHEDCPIGCKFHKKNNTEIHYTEVQRTNARLRIALNWIEFLKNDNSARELFYFNILGINLSELDLNRFGGNSDVELNIYNRFYRSVILSGLHYFFDKKQTVINNIYHDNGSQESHQFFPWHTIQKIELQSDLVTIRPKTVKFIDSDHRKSGDDESHLIQFIDIILGATYVCLHDPSERIEKRKVGSAFKPVLTTLLDRVQKESGGSLWGQYYISDFKRKWQVSFFPRTNNMGGSWRTLSDSEIKDIISSRNSYYYSRQIVVRDPSVTTLDRWF
ncbi:hypothetical protein [Methanogenium cariaci]|uniref:hypothetical protein n=1 Tax=Methanogenium cariaci TaxID=2197 RepID=UPI0012F68362|nr:hypothetical protein [Methanogenium cariaci]